MYIYSLQPLVHYKLNSADSGFAFPNTPSFAIYVRECCTETVGYNPPGGLNKSLWPVPPIPLRQTANNRTEILDELPLSVRARPRRHGHTVDRM